MELLKVRCYKFSSYIFVYAYATVMFIVYILTNCFCQAPFSYIVELVTPDIKTLLLFYVDHEYCLLESCKLQQKLHTYK